MAAFQYKPLTEPDAIRLLLLQPGSHEQELYCSLEHTTISHCDRDIVKHYIALSYVWGDPTKKEQIYVDSIPVVIGANLAAALRDIRDEIGTLRIWADALCIDQVNLEERSSQVALMGKIYSTAQHTIIHLSQGDGQKVLEAIPGNTIGKTVSYVHEDLITTAENTLLKMPWFSRVWVFQELVLSRNPWVQCGTVRAKWIELCEILLKPNEEDKPVSKEMWVLKDMNYARTYERHDLYRHLVARRGLGATDPRDFIFAHMNIAADAASLGKYVKVDYETSCGRIYNETALYLLEKEGPETLLRLATNNAEKSCMEGLASWSPDWSVPLDGPELMSDRHTFGMDGQDHFFSLDVEGSLMLGCLGLEVGEISSTSLSFPSSGAFETAVKQTYQQAWTNLKSFYLRADSMDMTTDYSYIPTMTTDEGIEHKRLVSILVTEFMKVIGDELPLLSADKDTHNLQTHQIFLRRLDNWLKRQRTEVLWYRRYGQRRIGMEWQMSLYLESDQERDVVDRDQDSILEGRRLAMTTLGKLCIVPKHTKVGDRIVYFAGSAAAYLIRPILEARDMEVHREQLKTLVAEQMMRVRISTTNHKKLQYMNDNLHVAFERPLVPCILVGECHDDDDEVILERKPNILGPRLYALS